MATYLWSTLTNGQTINPFNPSSDILRFDSAAISAASVSVQSPGGGASLFSFGGKTVTVQMPFFSITTANVTFANGSLLLVGDNAVGGFDHTGGILTGGAGADQLIAGSGGYTLFGRAGNDLLRGGSGNDSLDGESGNDVMAGGAGDDIYTVDSSADTVSEGAGAGTDHVDSTATYVLSANVESLTLGGAAAIHGTGNDLANAIIGNSADNDLFGLAGNDSLQGTGGSDDLTGGLGADRLDGGDGFDYVRYDAAASAVVVNFFNFIHNSGEAAGDVFVAVEGIYGSAFNDTLIANDNGNDILALGGNDLVYGHGGDDTIAGGDGNDQIEGGPGADAMNGGAGFDYVRYVYGSMVTADLESPAGNTFDAAGDTYIGVEGLVGSQFDDVLRGDANGNDLSGGGEHDTLVGRGGRDNLNGGVGDDILDGGAGNDFLNGGAGFDTATYQSSAAGLLVNMTTSSQSTGDAAGDGFLSVESLIGSNFNDTLVGDASVNSIQGMAGNDTVQGRGGDDIIQGLEGNDQLEGGLGADILDGGEGWDYARYVYATSAVTVDLSEAMPNAGEAAGDSLWGIEGVIGSAFADRMQGDDPRNDLAGLGGDDNLHGGAGDDNLQGGDGNDTLNGGENEDRIVGGAGNDVFVISRSESNNDEIVDFNGNGAAEGDTLLFVGYGTPADGATFVQVDATHWRIISADGGAVSELIEFSNGASIHGSDFTFI